MLSVIYGYTVGTNTRDRTGNNSKAPSSGNDDVFLNMAEECLALLSNRISGAFGVWAVDVFPFLRYVPECLLPGGWFKSEARWFKAKYEKFVDEPWQWAQRESSVSLLLVHYLVRRPHESTHPV